MWVAAEESQLRQERPKNVFQPTAKNRWACTGGDVAVAVVVAEVLHFGGNGGLSGAFFIPFLFSTKLVFSDQAENKFFPLPTATSFLFDGHTCKRLAAAEVEGVAVSGTNELWKR